MTKFLWNLTEIFILLLIFTLVSACAGYSPSIDPLAPEGDTDPGELENIITSHPNPTELLQKIQPGDVLKIYAYGAEWGGKYKVPPSGKLDLPPTGSIQVTDQTPVELKKELQSKLKNIHARPENIIRPNDKLKIHVGGEQWGGEFIVPPSGKLNFPTVDAIKVAGKTPLGFQNDLQKKLISQRLKASREIQPGDDLQFYVGGVDWSGEYEVPLNGKLDFPPTGSLRVSGKSLGEVRERFTEALREEHTEFRNVIKSGDVLKIKMPGKEWGGTYWIPPSGKLNFPPFKPIEVSGMTPRELQVELRKKFASLRSKDVRKIKPGDQLKILIFGSEWGAGTEWENTFLIPISGIIDLPKIGTVEVAGKTVEEFRDELKKKLKDIYLQQHYKIQPGDQLRIDVIGENWGKSYKVAPSGEIDFPYIGAVQAAKDSLVEFKERIIDKLKPDYFTNPRLSVNFESHQAAEIPVFSLNLLNNKNLSDTRISVNFESKNTTEIPPVSVNYANLPHKVVDGFSPPELSVNFASQISDNPPEISVNFESFGDVTIRVLGAVKRPQRVKVPRNTGVIDALLESGNITQNTIRDRIFVFRRPKDKNETIARMVNYEKYTRGDLTQNVILQEGDLVYAPVKFWPRIDTMEQLLGIIGGAGRVSREIRVLAE